MSHACFATGWFLVASIAAASTALAVPDSDGGASAPDPTAEKTECASAEACGLLADDYKIGKGVKADPERARRLYESSCQRGRAKSCHDLAFLLDIGMAPVARDERRAAQFFDKACSMGYSNSCLTLGTMYSQGARDPKAFARDYVRAAGYYKLGCDAKDGASCFSLAELYRSGRGVPKDKARAKRLLKEATALGFQLE
jgi:TPR repeat protein